ncbi:sigma-E processing peptidase SpoIIGA [Bacillus sp. AFS001701]|nr:sigma-E processing peptidase SpoIIGA [Bacillus sp. AFS001701]
MVIYGDLVWLLNLLMDFLIIQLTGLILKRNVSILRSLLGALLGSIVVLMTFTPYAYVFGSPFMKILLSFFIVFFAFGRQRIITFLQLLSIFYFSTFILGGALLGLHYLFATNESNLTNSSFYGDPVSWYFVIGMLPIVIFYARKSINQISFTKWKLNEMYEMEIVWRNTSIKIRGLMDSGNSLHEPLSRKPVIILDCSTSDYGLPIELVKLVRDSENTLHNTEALDVLSFFQGTYIPYKSIGQSNQFLVAIKPTVVKLKINGKWYSSSSVLVGLSHVTLSSDNLYECILHPKMMQGTINEIA